MEVHHHSHTERKKWTHYFWEFIMLFLAVFCGFLAENKREHLIEHKRDIQYMRTLVQDLQDDTALMNIIIADFTNKRSPFDTVIAEYPVLINGFSSAFVRNIFKIPGFEDFVPNDRTLQQLKNAGGMRLIRKPNVSDSIMLYDKKIKDLLIEQESIDDFNIKNRDIDELLNVEILAATITPGIIEKYEKENMNILVSNDRSLLSKYLGYTYAYRDVAGFYVLQLKEVSVYASRLIDLIRKEYHLK